MKLTGYKILEKIKRHFIQSGEYMSDTVIMLDEAEMAIDDALKNMESSSRIIERSLPEGLETKMERLTKAITKLHPTLAMDDPKHEELYLSLHELKDAVTSR